MLPRLHRLQKNDGITHIIRKGETRTTPFFIAKIRKNNKHICRFCVIVSYKILKKAVDRNHLRRQIYEIIRVNISCDKHTQHFDQILLIKKSSIGKKISHLETALINILPHNSKKYERDFTRRNIP